MTTTKSSPPGIRYSQYGRELNPTDLLVRPSFGGRRSVVPRHGGLRPGAGGDAGVGDLCDV